MTIITIIAALLSACGKDDDDQPVELLAPVLSDAINVTANSFSIDWEFVTGADAYEIDVSEDEGFTNFVSGYENLRHSFSEFTVIDLSAATTYFVRVRSVSRGIFSKYSNTISVETVDPSGGFDPGTFLKSAAAFPIGMAVTAGRLDGKHEEILLNEYDQITSEYEMKMNIMYPSEGNFDFTKADATVNWAFENGIDVHGHALIWHNAVPSWVENFSGTDAEFEDMIENYIKTTVTRYKGKVRSWDVVNEAFEDNSGTLRNSVFRRRMGDDYIEKCYRWVNEADPDVLIFYNDFNMIASPSKRRAALDLMKDFIERGVPVHGVGYQMHIGYNFPVKAEISKASKEATDLGLLLHFSELDVRANPANDLISLSQARSIAQQEKVKEVVEIYNAIPNESKFAITLWGMRDSETWLIDFWGHVDWPLLYNDDFSVKKAHTGFLDGLK